MANNSSLVTTGKPKVGGSVYRAPKGTQPPTSATATLAETYKNMGYISQDGVSNTISWDSETVKEWGGGDVIAFEDNKSDTFKMKFIESLNPEVLKAVHGDSNVTGTDASTTTGLSVAVNGDEHEEHVWVIDMILKGGIFKRIVIPCGTVSAVEEIVYKKNEAIGYNVTLKATLDSSSNYHYEYMQKPSTTGDDEGNDNPGQGETP